MDSAAQLAAAVADGVADPATTSWSEARVGGRRCRRPGRAQQPPACGPHRCDRRLRCRRPRPARLEIDVAVGDARQRAELHDRLGTGPERRVVLVVDRERDLGEPVGRHVDLLDGAYLRAPDPHLVALHELSRVLELGGDLVAAPAEHQDGRKDHDSEPERHGRQNAG